MSHPDFEALGRFAQELLDEADWVENLHRDDHKRGGTGQARTDARALRDLAARVAELDEDAQRIGRRLGYAPAPPKE